MGTIGLVIRLLIFAIFSVAGISKLLDLNKTRTGIQDFGLPAWAAKPLSILLPLTELTTAVLLIPLSTVLWAGLGAIALVIAFIIAISINLILGRKPDCNCFGQLHATPIGWSTLLRNCILICGAGIVVWQALTGVPISVVAWRGGLSDTEVLGIFAGAAGLVIITAEGWLLLHLLRQNGRLLLRMDALEAKIGHRIVAPQSNHVRSGLPIGTLAPNFKVATLSTDAVLTLDSLRTERRAIVLIFSDPNCGPCSALLPDIVRWEKEHAAALTIALVSRGSREANRAKIGEHQLRYVLLQKDREIAEAYKASGTPAAALIGADGTIASFIAMGAEAIAALVASALPGAPPLANGNYEREFVARSELAKLEIGHPAPPLKLPDLDGRIVELSKLRGRETLVLFWNPDCGFCAKMLPDLRTWEEQASPQAPQFLVVSSGTVDKNRAMALRSTIVIDQTFSAGKAFHAHGTPSGVLLDAEGKVNSRIANGASAVFALANTERRISV